MEVALLRAGVGGWELDAIVAVVVLRFGVWRIPALARGIGVGVHELRNAPKSGGYEKGAAEAEKPGRRESAEETPGEDAKDGQRS